MTLEIRQMQALALHDLCSTPPHRCLCSPREEHRPPPTVLQKAQGPATTSGKDPDRAVLSMQEGQSPPRAPCLVWGQGLVPSLVWLINTEHANADSHCHTRTQNNNCEPSTRTRCWRVSAGLCWLLLTAAQER